MMSNDFSLITYFNRLIVGEDMAEYPLKSDSNVFDFVKKNKIIPFLVDKVSLFPSDIQISVLEGFSKYKNIADTQIELFKYISDIFMKNNIEFIPVKGFIFSSLLYDNVYKHISADIDIIVKEDELIYAVELLIDEGFMLLSFISDDVDYELTSHRKVFIPWTRLFHEITLYKVINGNKIYIELKKTTGAVKDDRIKFFVERTIEYNFQGRLIKIFDIERVFLNAILNIYVHTEHLDTHGSTCLRDFYDIYFFVKKFEIDWTVVSNLSRIMKVNHMVYNVLSNILVIFDGYDMLDIKKNINLFSEFQRKDVYLFPDGSIVDWGNKDMIKTKIMNSSVENGKLIAYKYINKIYSNRNPNFLNPYNGGQFYKIKDIGVLYSLKLENKKLYISLNFKCFDKLSGYRLMIEIIKQQNIKDTLEKDTLDMFHTIVFEPDENNVIVAFDGNKFNTIHYSSNISVGIELSYFHGINDWSKICYDVLYDEKIYEGIYKTVEYDSLFYTLMNNPSVVRLL